MGVTNMVVRLLSFVLLFCCFIMVAAAGEIDLEKKEIRIGNEIKTIDIGYYGLGFDLRFDQSMKDHMVIEYPGKMNGKQFRVSFEHRADTLKVLVLPEGFKPSDPDDARGLLVNFLKMVVDILEMKDSSDPRYFTVTLPVRFEGHVCAQAVL